MKKAKPIKVIGSKRYMYSWQDIGFDELRDYSKRIYWNPRYRDCRGFELSYSSYGSDLTIGLWYGNVEIALRKPKDSPNGE
jgi:hypothetical protein